MSNKNNGAAKEASTRNKGSKGRVVALVVLVAAIIAAAVFFLSSYMEPNPLKGAKSLTNDEFVNFVSSYISEPKPVKPLSKLIDSRVGKMTTTDVQFLRESEWINIVMNINKYMTIINPFANSLVFDDDGNIMKKETFQNNSDAILKVAIENALNDGFLLMWRNDSLYITIDMDAFLAKIDGAVTTEFADYIKVVAMADSMEIVKDGKIFYEKFEELFKVEDEYLKKYIDDTENLYMETILNQYAEQLRMYFGLYGIGGYFNSDGSINEDFIERLKGVIDAEPEEPYAIVFYNVHYYLETTGIVDEYVESAISSALSTTWFGTQEEVSTDDVIIVQDDSETSDEDDEDYSEQSIDNDPEVGEDSSSELTDDDTDNMTDGDESTNEEEVTTD